MTLRVVTTNTTKTAERPPRRFGSLTIGAEMLGVSDKTLRRMIADGTVTGYRLGKRLIRVDLDELEGLLRVIPSARVV